VYAAEAADPALLSSPGSALDLLRALYTDCAARSAQLPAAEEGTQRADAVQGALRGVAGCAVNGKAILQGMVDQVGCFERRSNGSGAALWAHLHATL
jgi:hypothetical protein